MIEYYGKDGLPMSREDWMETYELGMEYKRVAETQVGDVWISTVWLGLDHNYGDGPPLIFETMAFTKRDGNVDFGNELYCDRYATIEQARDGHKRVVKKFREGTLPDAIE